MDKPLEHHITVRLNEETQKKLEKLATLKHKFESPSHVIRSGIMMVYRKEFGTDNKIEIIEK